MKKVALANGRLPKDTLEQIDNMKDAAAIAELLQKTRHLTEQAFDEYVDSLGARAARLVLRARAVSGDIKALELYLRLAKESRKEREAVKREPMRHVTPSAFLPADRSEANMPLEQLESADSTDSKQKS